MVPRIGLYVAASWLIAAHFLRANDLVLTGLCLAAPLLFFVRRRWTLLIQQGLAYAASMVWLITTWQIVSLRHAFGAPWGRSAAIMLSVTMITLLAGWSLRRLGTPNLSRPS